MFSDEQELDLERERVRIQGRQLKSQLARLEQALKRKDQLSGGLHLVDYEQLKMENEVMTEKVCILPLSVRTVPVHDLERPLTFLLVWIVSCKERGNS